MREYIKKNAQKAIAREEGNTNHLETNQNTTFKNSWTLLVGRISAKSTTCNKRKPLKPNKLESKKVTSKRRA